MRDILPALEEWQRQGEEIAVATVVRVRGSAPRPLGSRLAVTASGRMAGSVSGGCVETDVFERAQQLLEGAGCALVRYDAIDEDELGIGLACGGSIDVLIEVFAPTEAWRAARAAVEQRRPIARCVAVDPELWRGRQLAIAADGTRSGGIDPALDALLADRAARRLDIAGAITLDLEAAGGTATVLFETLLPPPRLYLVGATHVAIPLCRLAREVGFFTCVIDPRSVFATDERFADADELVRAWPDEALEKVEFDADSHLVALTHDTKFDLPALAAALRSEAGYVGALGSRATHQRRLAKLREEGFGERELARIHTPVGLDLGARAPEEIALSILAEIVAVRNGRRGGALRERATPIHADD